ncbi:hypothetical protein HERIO_132 [Hepatospora eriocheir]|uniref:Uncharacterized protein n=1 Tax=Hepatospora eriocheir TaxID=1081669 RepID=A0A1X0QE85_9MICR|nr:hypothetical protein HERIO_132 [Hepatospora eriocheir]
MREEEFKKSYFKRYEKELERLKLINKILDKQNEVDLLKTCVNIEKQTESFYPLLAGTGKDRISVLNLGQFPPYKVSYDYIMPVDYMVKKKFYKHKNSKLKADKIFYYIKVNSDGIIIESEDKVKFKDWETFYNSVENNSKLDNLPEFLGLKNFHIASYIERLGDVSEYKDYVPLKVRKI